MTVKIRVVRETLEKVLVKKGLSKEDAKILAAEYLEGELQEKFSHGLAAFPSIVKIIPASKTKTEVLKKTHSLLFIDAHQAFGAIVGKQTVDQLIKMSQKEGLAIALIKNMTTWLRPGTLAKTIADKSYIGIVTNTGGQPMVAPPGGFDPVIGTNPIGIGIPTDKEPIVVDMATAKHAWGLVGISQKLNQKLPENTFYNKSGVFTQEPGEAYSVAPAGDYKGFALGLLIEILCGALIGMPMGGKDLPTDYRTIPRGAMILVIDPRLSNFESFKRAVTCLANDIKKSHRIDSKQEILIPGERSLKKKTQKLADGSINIEDSVWQTIIKL